MQQTKVEIPYQPLIDYLSSYAFLGSCFSEHLSQKMAQSGFSVHANPFGVVFNPISLADLILSSEKELKYSVVERDDVALSWLANSSFYEYSSEKLKDKLVKIRNAFLNDLTSAKVLFIDRKSTRLNSSHVRISYAVFCLKKKKNIN